MRFWHLRVFKQLYNINSCPNQFEGKNVSFCKRQTLLFQAQNYYKGYRLIGSVHIFLLHIHIHQKTIFSLFTMSSRHTEIRKHCKIKPAKSHNQKLQGNYYKKFSLVYPLIQNDACQKRRIIFFFTIGSFYCMKHSTRYIVW